MWGHIVLQLLPCHKSSLSQLPMSAPSTNMDECFLFNSLVIRLPYSPIFWWLWLFFFISNLLLSFFWLWRQSISTYVSILAGGLEFCKMFMFLPSIVKLFLRFCLVGAEVIWKERKCNQWGFSTSSHVMSIAPALVPGDCCLIALFFFQYCHYSLLLIWDVIMLTISSKKSILTMEKMGKGLDKEHV